MCKEDDQELDVDAIKSKVSEAVDAGIDRSTIVTIMGIFKLYAEGLEKLSRKAVISIKSEIKRLTSLDIDHNQVLRFALNKDNGSFDKPSAEYKPSGKVQKAIITFLAHPEVHSAFYLGLLDSEEQPDYVLPQHLAKYFQPNLVGVKSSYNGIYGFERDLGDNHILKKQIFIEGEPELIFYRIEESVSRYWKAGDGKLAPATDKEGKHDRALKVSGWGIFIRNDELLIFLKHASLDKTKIFMSISGSAKMAVSERVSKLYLIESRELLPINGSIYSNLEKSIKEQLSKIDLSEKTVVFKRVEDFSGKRQEKEGTMGKDDELEDEYTGGTRLEAASFLDSKQKQQERQAMDKDGLGVELHRAIDDLHISRVKEILGQAASIGCLHDVVNYFDTFCELTPFHIAAGNGDWEILQVLLDTEECDLLKRDGRQRLTSIIAAMSKQPDAPEWHAKLMEMEWKYGEERGLIPLGHETVPWPEGYRRGIDNLDDFLNAKSDNPEGPETPGF